LGEAILLACDERKDLKPTLAEVDMTNLFRFMRFCKEIGVTAGDFKTGEIPVSDDDIRDAFLKRGLVSSVEMDN